jgi:hypothetical protein
MRRAVPMLLVVALTGCVGDDVDPRAATAPVLGASAAPEPVQPEPGEPQAPTWRHLIARVKAPGAAFLAEPGGKRLGRIGRKTEFGGPRFLGVTGRREGWLRILVPERGNGEHAWIRARKARMFGTDVSLHVDRSARRLAVRDGDRVVMRLPVAVGRPEHPTPLGRYAVTDKLKMNGPGTTYGCCALALTGHQTDLPSGWAGGDRLAIHGTSDPGSIGLAASTGCLRASDRDLRRLLRRVPVGAPVFVRA